MPEVKELDAQKAIAQALKNGSTDYSKLLGPDWRNKLKALAEQLDVVRELNLPLGVLELKSGGTADDADTNEDEDGNSSDEDEDTDNNDNDEDLS